MRMSHVWQNCHLTQIKLINSLSGLKKQTVLTLSLLGKLLTNCSNGRVIKSMGKFVLSLTKIRKLSLLPTKTLLNKLFVS